MFRLVFCHSYELLIWFCGFSSCLYLLAIVGCTVFSLVLVRCGVLVLTLD